MKKVKIIRFTWLLCSLFLLAACREDVQPTSVEIKDPERHYYPIMQGQELEVVFKITNTGENPLVIREIHPSCGCIVSSKKKRIIIPKGGDDFIHLTYNSNKNVGYAEHTIRLYGNILPQGEARLWFDVNVVPHADYTRDYEQLYRDYNTKNGIVTEMVDGKESQRLYYVGEP